MQENKSYKRVYMMGNTATQLEELPQRHTEPRSVPSRRGKQQSQNGQKLRLVGSLFVFFFAIISLMYGYARLAEKQKELQLLKNDLKQIQEQNNLLKTEIAETIDLRAVEKRAMNVMGMVKPSKHQFVAIQTPEENYTIQYQPMQNKVQDASSILGFE